MSKTAMIRARIEPAVKKNAEAIFQALGLSVTDAVSMFFNQVILKKGIPFELKVPNKTTQKALMDVSRRKNLSTYKSVDELRKKYSK